MSDDVRRARAQGFAAGVRWARRRYRAAIEAELDRLNQALLWRRPGLEDPVLPDVVYGDPPSDRDMLRLEADMKQAHEEDNDMPF